MLRSAAQALTRVVTRYPAAVMPVPRIGAVFQYHTIGSRVSTVCNKYDRLAAFPTHASMALLVRGYKNKKAPRGLKTRQAVAKRFIVSRSGKLKYGHAGKAHLNVGKSQTRLTRLNKKGSLKGPMFKKMNSMILTGK